jgi:hypothetical protein
MQSNGVRKAFVLINGLQLIQCALPTPSEGSCVVETPAQAHLRVLDDFGRIELSCVFYASSDVIGERCPWVATLWADDEEIDLGHLPHAASRARVVCRYVRNDPKTLKLTVTFRDAETYPHPEEKQLLEVLRLVLLNDGLRSTDEGFVRLSHLQNKLEGLELYKRVVGKDDQHYRNLYSFVVSHPKALELQRVAGGEARVALVGERPESRYVDDELHESLDREAVECLKTLTAEGDVDAVTALAVLGNCDGFRRMLRPSEQVIFRFLCSHSNQFLAKHDPIHSTRVGSR